MKHIINKRSRSVTDFVADKIQPEGSRKMDQLKHKAKENEIDEYIRVKIHSSQNI